MNTADLLKAHLPSDITPAPKVRWKPNVTVAALIERDGRFLLVEEETSDGLLLNNPAGHLDPGESPIEGVIRETLEETTCTFTPEGFLGVYMSRFRRTRTGEDITYLRMAFCGSVSVSPSHAVGDLRWKIGYSGSCSETMSKTSCHAFSWVSPVAAPAVSSSACTWV